MVLLDGEGDLLRDGICTKCSNGHIEKVRRGHHKGTVYGKSGQWGYRQGEGGFPDTRCDGRIPSISLILAATDDQSALYHWQKGMVSRLGLAGFRRWMSARLKSGISFHRTVHELLKEKEEEGEITRTDEEIVQGVEQECVLSAPYVRSVLPVLRSLVLSGGSLLAEKSFAHPHLAYRGRFDAVLPLSDGPVMVDWKTSSQSSSISRSLSTGSPLLYSYPTQIAAYLGGFNADPNYSQYPKIHRGLLVVAHEDGKPANVVWMNKEDVCREWDGWKERLQRFWNILNEHDKLGKNTVNLRFQLGER